MKRILLILALGGLSCAAWGQPVFQPSGRTVAELHETRTDETVVTAEADINKDGIGDLVIYLDNYYPGSNFAFYFGDKSGGYRLFRDYETAMYGDVTGISVTDKGVVRIQSSRDGNADVFLFRWENGDFRLIGGKKDRHAADHYDLSYNYLTGKMIRTDGEGKDRKTHTLAMPAQPVIHFGWIPLRYDMLDYLHELPEDGPGPENTEDMLAWGIFRVMQANEMLFWHFCDWENPYRNPSPGGEAGTWTAEDEHLSPGSYNAWSTLEITKLPDGTYKLDVSSSFYDRSYESLFNEDMSNVDEIMAKYEKEEENSSERWIFKNGQFIPDASEQAADSNAPGGNWSGKLEVQGMKLTIVFHLDGDEPTMDSPDQAAQDIPIQVEWGELGKITIKIPMLGASYEGLWLGPQIMGTFTQMGKAFPLTLTPEIGLNRPQTPQGPFPYNTEEVAFDNGEAHLEGTLVLPEGYSRQTPVLIFVTGSGQEDRDETIFDHKPFAVIADALGRAGIATLRFDDRGVGGSTGDVANATTEDFRDDALAGIRMLRERFDKVGVIGHSEGGTIALMLAADGQADFIVSLAGMAVSGLETIVAQSRVSLESAGYTGDTVDKYCEAVRQASYVRVHGGRMPFPDELDLPDELKQAYQAVMRQIQIPWMIKFLSLDMQPLLGRITCPVLAINGTKDIQVAYESNLGALRRGLPANPKNKIEAIEGVNHLFQHCTTGAITEYRQIEETFAPEALEMIVNWLSDFK